MAIPILAAIARDRGWEYRYFDTSFYEKGDDSTLDKEKTGGFKPGKKDSLPDTAPREHLISDFQALVDEFEPDLIAMTAMTNDFQYLMTFFQDLKLPEKTMVAIGGTHSLHRSEEILNTDLFDISCYGQGESVFPEILSRVEDGKDLEGIPGTWTKNKSTGELVNNCVSAALGADELWGFEPDYSFYDQRYYAYPFDGNTVNMFWLEVGRGCPFGCTYCEAPQLRKLYLGLGKYVISRPIDNIFETIKQVQKKYDIDVFNITHECFLSQRDEWIEEFVDRWAKEVGKSFLIQTRLETIDDEKLRLLKKSKAPSIQVGMGIESGSQRIVSEICNRKINVQPLIESYHKLRKEGFRTNAYYMMGFPTETRQDIFETIKLCRAVNSDVDSVSIFQPYPGLPLTKMCLDMGLIKGDEPIPTFTESSVINQPSISSEEVTNLRRVFLLYAKLPEKYWPEIEKCELNFEKNKDLYERLLSLRWELQGKDTSAETLEGMRVEALSSC